MSERLKDDIWAALQKAPKPLTEELALDIANKAMDGHPTEIHKFGEWFQDNGKALVKRLNA